MQKQRHVVTFQAGIRADTTPDIQPPGTYRDALGMGLRFQDGQGGQAMNLSAIVGAEALLDLPDGFDDLGSAEVFIDEKRYLLIFLANGSSSQFGLLDIAERLTAIAQEAAYVPPVARYTLLYDDTNDPNGERLNFLAGNTLRVIVEANSATVIRVLINDRRSEPLCINLHLGFGSLTPIQAHAVYPRYWSAHAFRLQPEVQFTLMKFSRRVPGNLPTGAYRYSYRYVLTPSSMPEEVCSVCYPPPPSLILPEGDPVPSNQNHHKVFLREVGTPTPFGLEFYLDNPDPRWSRVQLLVSYSPDNESYGPWVVADQRDNPRGSLLSFIHDKVAGTGRSITTQEVAAQWQTLQRADDIYKFKDRLWIGGPDVGFTGDMISRDVTLSVFYRDMAMDEKRAVFFDRIETTTEPTDVLQNVGIATSSTIEETLCQRAGSGLRTARFSLDGDFATYKGIQIASRYAAYRHGERYPMGAMLLDLKGQPTSVIPLGDFVVPAMREGETLTTYQASTDTYLLRIAQLKISGLRLPLSVVYDKNGRRIVSGLLIVRGRASGAILHQGVIQNLVRQATNTEVSERRTVLPTYTNFADDNGLLLNPTMPVLVYQGTKQRWQDAGGAYLESSYVSYLSGDLLMEDGELVADKKRDSLELVATAHPVYQPGFVSPQNLRVAGPIELRGNGDHTYTKNYAMQFSPVRPAATGRSWPGKKSNVSVSFTVRTWGGDSAELKLTFDPESPALRFQADLSAVVQGPSDVRKNTFRDGYTAKGTVILKAPGLGFVDAGRSALDPAGVMIANYRREVINPPVSSINYQTTGYFLPLTDSVLSDLPQQGSDLMLNQMEVGGGDTYPTPVDMLRIYPAHYGDDRREVYTLPEIKNRGYSDQAPDYAVGMIVPLECRYNLWLRSGRHYAASASYPGNLAKGDQSLKQFADGINHQQAEYWNTSIAARLGNETIRLFKARPADIRIEKQGPYSILYSEVAVAGESLFRLRRIPPLNFGLLDSQYGPFVGFSEQFLYLYAGQYDAIGRLQIAERSQVIDESGKTILLGEGQAYGGVDYVVKGAGWQQWPDSFSSPKALYWLDRSRGKFSRLSQAGVDVLSDRDGQHDRITRLLSNPGNPLLPANRPVAGAYDPVNNRIWLSFSDQALLYNEDLNAFECRWVENPLRYHAFGGSLLSRRQKTVYRHSTGLAAYGYGEATGLMVEVIASPRPTGASTFDTLSIPMLAGQYPMLSRVELWTPEQQQTQVILPRVDEAVYFEEGHLWIPMRQQEVPLSGDLLKMAVEDFPRLRGRYVRIRLYFDKVGQDPGVLLYLQSLSVDYRPSPRY